MRRLLQLSLDFFGPAQPVEVMPVATPSVASPAWTHPQANRQIRLGQTVLGYQFARGRRRTIGFVVGPEGLVVRAPRWTPLYEVEAALQEKANWIVGKLAQTQERQQRLEQSRIEWRDGALFPFLGESLQLVLDPHAGMPDSTLGSGGDASVQSARTLRLVLAVDVPPEQIRDSVRAWMMEQAQTHFRQRLDHYAPRLGVQWRALRLSNAVGRWGSARSDGSIRLNWRLIQLRPALVDYVVVHELSHLRVMDHSPRFWDTVRSVVPDYTQLRRELQDDSIPRW
ncbi:MAG: SprT family zinc-dependent metalloprotease [Burkholderiales bacterium]|nr:SprT family zinc-dependent metalloprotease [Burkholderiales bacterium]